MNDRRRIVELAQGERLGEKRRRIELAGGDVDDRRNRIDPPQRGAQRAEPGGALLGGDQIALGDADAVGEPRLPLRFAVDGECGGAVDCVDDGRHAGDAEARGEARIGGQREQNRRGIGEAGRLQDDAGERRDCPGVAAIEEIVEPVDQVAAQRAAQAAGIERDDLPLDRLEQQMVEADLAPFVDDHQRLGERRALQQAVDQAGLAGAEEAGDDMQRDWLARALIRSSCGRGEVAANCSAADLEAVLSANRLASTLFARRTYS